ncbi:DUF2958 domain-containing protein [Desulfocastanea catecholica]
MWNIPSKKRLQQIPQLYATEDIELKDKLIYLHFFIGGSDWYIAEYDGQDTFWGYAIFNGDDQNAEWGYISFSDLKGIKIGYVEIDCELYWRIKPASQIDKIKT